MLFITLTTYNGKISINVRAIESVSDLKSNDNRSRVHMNSGAHWDVTDDHLTIIQMIKTAEYSVIG